MCNNRCVGHTGSLAWSIVMGSIGIAQLALAGKSRTSVLLVDTWVAGLADTHQWVAVRTPVFFLPLFV